MMLPRMQASPMPMKTMSGFDSDTATAPTDDAPICPSVTGAQVSPPSVVFHSPPPTAPKYASFGRPFTPLTAIERPPRAGPMLRHCVALEHHRIDARRRCRCLRRGLGAHVEGHDARQGEQGC